RSRVLPKLLPLRIVDREIMRAAGAATAAGAPDPQQNVIAVGFLAERHGIVRTFYRVLVYLRNNIAGTKSCLCGIGIWIYIRDKRALNIAGNVRLALGAGIEVTHF